MSLLLTEARRAPTDAFAIIGGLASASGFLGLFGYEFGVQALRRVADQFALWSDRIWSAIGSVVNIDVSAPIAAVLTLFLIGLGLCARGWFRRYPHLSSLASWEIFTLCGVVAFVLTSLYRHWDMQMPETLWGQILEGGSVIVLGFVYCLYPRMLFGAVVATGILVGTDIFFNAFNA